MRENISDLWFSWFYKNWEKNAPGNLIEKVLSPSQIADRFVNENHKLVIFSLFLLLLLFIFRSWF